MKKNLTAKQVDTIIKKLDYRIKECQYNMPLRYNEGDLEGYVRAKAELNAYSDAYAVIISELRS